MATGLNPSEETEKSLERTGSRRTLLLAAAGILIGVLLGVLILRFVFDVPLFGPPQFNGTVIDSTSPQPNFTLTGPNGKPVNLIDYRGKVVMLYFGYTYCPDICPATMAELADAVEALGRRGDEVQVIMVSVDPERDTPERLAQYVSHFHPSFIGVTGTEEELVAVTTPLGIFYEKHEGTAASGYLIDHTATVVVLDKKGYLRLVYSFGTTGEEMAEDLRYLVRQ